MPNPTIIPTQELKELMNVPDIRDAWAIDESETVESFSARVYGVKFLNSNGAPANSSAFYILTDGISYGTSMMIEYRQRDNLFTACT